VPGLARCLLGLGIAATLAANVTHGLGHGLIGAAVAAWPAVALVGSYELLMLVIRGAQARPGASVMPRVPGADPLQEQAPGVSRPSSGGADGTGSGVRAGSRLPR
jgi:hypothetical protein